MATSLSHVEVEAAFPVLWHQVIHVCVTIANVVLSFLSLVVNNVNGWVQWQEVEG